MKYQVARIAHLGLAMLALAALAVSQAEAKWARPTDMPIPRLLKNVGDYVKAHPGDAEGYYQLGRIHSAAFALDTENLGVYTDAEKGLSRIPQHGSNIPTPRDQARPLTAQTMTYLAEAIRNYKKATQLDPNSALAWLGLGFECEEAQRFPQAAGKAGVALSLKKTPDTEALRQQALQFYRKAYALTIHSELKEEHGHLTTSVSQEAGEGIIRLQQGKDLSKKDLAELTELQANVAKLRSKPRPITPILLSFQKSSGLSDLLSPGSKVRFDLSGEGTGREWPWVKPTTGILVWDPKHTGKITSGLQLFGSVTWWLFWKDGYAPLVALDNNRSGWLEGKELLELAVWFDRNGNGVSEPGEVVSMASLGVRRLSVRASGQSEGVLCNTQGVEMKDGSFAATFDWTPTALYPSAGPPLIKGAQESFH